MHQTVPNPPVDAPSPGADAATLPRFHAAALEEEVRRKVLDRVGEQLIHLSLLIRADQQIAPQDQLGDPLSNIFIRCAALNRGTSRQVIAGQTESEIPRP